MCLGSFLNVVIHRLPKEGQSIFHPRRSVCPACHHEIAWYDNLPLLSYLLLRARCRHCAKPISLRYPVVELTCGLLTLAVLHHAGLSWRALADLYLVLALVAVTFIDLDEMIIPDAITLPGMAVALLFSVISPTPEALLGPWLDYRFFEWGLHGAWLRSLIGSALGLVLGGALIWVIFQVYFLVRKDEGIGGGDFTLLAMIGAFLGYRSVFVTIFMASLVGMLGAIAMAVRQKGLSLQMRLPFGPFLSIGALVFMFWGEALLRWYWGQ